MTGRILNDPRLPGADPGLWVERYGDTAAFAGRPALFLDRDGVINRDSGYPSRPADIEILDSIVPAIGRANRAGWPVVVVTNQSGIARGLFGWDDFAAVSDHIAAELGRRGVRLDLVHACAYHDSGRPPLAVADHPMRKPNPGAFLAAARLAALDLAGSVMIGDRTSDFEAAARAGVRLGFAAEAEALAGAVAATAGRLGLTLRPLAEALGHIG